MMGFQRGSAIRFAIILPKLIPGSSIKRYDTQDKEIVTIATTGTRRQKKRTELLVANGRLKMIRFPMTKITNQWIK
jgi:hypothetical protein